MRKRIKEIAHVSKHHGTSALIWMFVLLLPLLTACEKEPINRNIEGHWRLDQFTILKTQETVHCERIFWGITRAGAKLQEKQGPNGNAPLDAQIEYRNEETLLVLKDILVIGENTKATPEQLYPYGLNNARETVFQVIKSTHKHMILASDYAQLTFTKF